MELITNKEISNLNNTVVFACQAYIGTKSKGKLKLVPPNKFFITNSGKTLCRKKQDGMCCKKGISIRVNWNRKGLKIFTTESECRLYFNGQCSKMLTKLDKISNKFSRAKRKNLKKIVK
jgi:hypothetical protein